MWHELRAVFDTLSEDASVRVVVLSGAGEKAFSAGLDVASAAVPGSLFNPGAEDIADGARYATKVRRFALQFQESISSIERCEKRESIVQTYITYNHGKPQGLQELLAVICVLHGISIGIALDICTCADLRICTSDVVFSVKEVDIGVASDVSTLTRMPKVVGSYAWIKDVCLTARNFGAEEALRVGFVNSVFPDKAQAITEAFRIAEVIASKSPVAVQGTKNFLDWCRDHDVATGKPPSLALCVTAKHHLLN